MFDELQKLDIKEVVSRTHLDEAVIRAIITRDFEKLKNTNINMNLKILNREFGIDFSEWLEDFNNYKKNNFCDDEKSLKVKPKIMTYHNSDGNGNYISYILYAFLLVLIVLGGIFYYYNYIEDVETKPVVEESEKIVEKIEPKIQKEELKENIEEIKKEESVKELEEEQINENQDENIKSQKEDENTQEQPSNTQTQAIQEQEIQPQQHKLNLKPNSKSWVSVKNLKTKETKNYMLEKAISFDEDVLIFIGKTDYSLLLDDKEIVSDKNDSRYILFKDGKVEFLTQDKYKKIDKAK